MDGKISELNNKKCETTYLCLLAATDSAAPCSMMFQIATNLKTILNEKKQSEVSLRFIFFDGEEAFKDWNRQDSLYGSRHLAQKWEREPYPEGGGDSNQLDRIVCYTSRHTLEK